MANNPNKVVNDIEEIKEDMIVSSNDTVEDIQTVSRSEFEDLVENNGLTPKTVYNIPDSINSTIPEGVISSPDKSVTYMITLTQSSFDALVASESLIENTVYNIVED